ARASAGAAPPPGAVALRGEGVGGEACHGPASGPHPWLAVHTAPDKWRKKYAKTPNDPEWKKYGFTDLADLRVQAETCAGCHVGAPPDEKRGIPARDVNHDLMAAGHPAPQPRAARLPAQHAPPLEPGEEAQAPQGRRPLGGQGLGGRPGPPRQGAPGPAPFPRQAGPRGGGEAEARPRRHRALAGV